MVIEGLTGLTYSTIWTVSNDRGTFVWRMDPVMRLVVLDASSHSHEYSI